MTNVVMKALLEIVIFNEHTDNLWHNKILVMVSRRLPPGDEEKPGYLDYSDQPLSQEHASDLYKWIEDKWNLVHITEKSTELHPKEGGK